MLWIGRFNSGFSCSAYELVVLTHDSVEMCINFLHKNSARWQNWGEKWDIIFVTI